MNVDEVITAVTNADSEGSAFAFLRSVPPKMLEAVADQLHIDTSGHGNQWIRNAIVKEARA